MARVTVKDIALRAGVSVCTVSKVLNGRTKEARIAEQRAKAILSIAREMNFRPSAAARAIRSQQNRHVGVLLRNTPADRMAHPLVFETILGINEGLDEAGYVLSIIRLDDVMDTHSQRGRVLRENLLDGVIVLDLVPDGVMQQLDKIAAYCIWIDAAVYGPENCIRRDEYEVGRTVASHMADLGYRKLTWLGLTDVPGLRGYSLAERYAGISSYALQHGIELDRIMVPGYEASLSAGMMPALRPENGVIACGIYQARWLTQLAGSTGLVPGYDFGLACCDGAQEIYRLWPGLSRVDFNRFDLGYRAAKMMLKVIEEPGHAVPSYKVSGNWIAGNTAWGPKSYRLAMQDSMCIKGVTP